MKRFFLLLIILSLSPLTWALDVNQPYILFVGKNVVAVHRNKLIFKTPDHVQCAGGTMPYILPSNRTPALPSGFDYSKDNVYTDIVLNLDVVSNPGGGYDINGQGWFKEGRGYIFAWVKFDFILFCVPASRICDGCSYYKPPTADDRQNLINMWLQPPT